MGHLWSELESSLLKLLDFLLLPSTSSSPDPCFLIPFQSRDARGTSQVLATASIFLGLPTPFLLKLASRPPLSSGPGSEAWAPEWDNRQQPAGLGEHCHTLSQPLQSHIGQWLSFPCWGRGDRGGQSGEGLGGEAAWLSCVVICPLGQFASKWKRTFLGMNDERGFVLPLQPAVTVYEVSHVLGFCQRGGFDGQGLQRREQLSMRPQSLGWSLPHRKREETADPCHPSPARIHPCLSRGLACIPCSHQRAIVSSLPTDCLKL